MLTRSILDNSIALGLFALVTAGLLAGTFLGTRDQIELAERAAAQRALLEIIPLERHDNDMLMDTLGIPVAHRATLGVTSDTEIHIARHEGRPVAVIVPSVAPNGYSGPIQLIIGINMDGTLAGVRVINHRETPGLGDKVELKKSDWILEFDGKSLADPTPEGWRVRKDGGEFDQFTGATITPRAVVNQVQRTLQYFEADRERLLREAERLKEGETREGDDQTTGTMSPDEDSAS